MDILSEMLFLKQKNASLQTCAKRRKMGGIGLEPEIVNISQTSTYENSENQGAHNCAHFFEKHPDLQVIAEHWHKLTDRQKQRILDICFEVKE